MPDMADAICVDSTGVYVTGDTSGDFPGWTNQGYEDVFVRKYDASGNELWTRQFGTAAGDFARGICADSTGVYVAGTTEGPPPGEPPSGWHYAFVHKYDFDGNELWIREFGSDQHAWAEAICADSTGIYVAGTADAFPGHTSYGYNDAFVRKYDASGNELWTSQFGTADPDGANAVCINSAGICVAGETTNFGVPDYPTDVFVCQLDGSGNQLWSHQFGSPDPADDDGAYGICADSTGTYVVGETEGVLPGQTSSGSFDAFVRKYDASGNELWTRQFGTAGRDASVDICADSAGPYVGGFAGGYAGGDPGGALPGQTNFGHGDVYVRQYDASGNELWTHQFGTAGHDVGRGICADSAGIYLAGFTADVLPGQTSSGWDDAFVVKFSAPSDITAPSVAMVSPPSGYALQDGVTFVASATDTESGVASVSFSIREDNGGSGTPIGYEDIPGIQDPATGNWELWFDTLQLPDGWYVVVVKATDNEGNEGSIAVPYSIRNWAVLEQLPATQNNKAGRTMPIKFSLRVSAAVDPARPFVYNEDLTIKILIVKIPPPNILVQTSVFGTGSRDYRIDVPTQKYIVNFQTSKTPQTYLVEIWRTGKNFLVGSFTFKTVK